MPPQRFYWTPELDAMLRQGYAHASDRRAKSAVITQVQRHTGFSRPVINLHIRRLGLTEDLRRPWTGEELAYLRESAGVVSLRAMSRHLNRPFDSVKSKLQRLHVSFRVRDGYTIQDLSQLLGVSDKTVAQWLKWGWLRRRNDRVSEPEVQRFLRLHAERYDLRRVDQPWFKGMVFPLFGLSELGQSV